MSLLILDMGGSSVRALLFDDALQLISSAQRHHQFDVSEPGEATAQRTSGRGRTITKRAPRSLALDGVP